MKARERTLIGLANVCQKKLDVYAFIASFTATDQARSKRKSPKMQSQKAL